MIEYRILKSIAIGFLIATAGCQEKKKPNFVFILADDLGYMDVGFNNPETFYDTPNLNTLAEESTVFTDGYAACPVCSPTRASIMTGKYPARLKTTDYFGAPAGDGWKRNTPLLPPKYADSLAHSETTLAEALKNEGYSTFFAGKWHLGNEPYWPEHQGFDYNKGGITRGGPYGGDRYFSPYGNPRLEDGPKGEHLPDRLASETVDFIKDNSNKPFMAYLSFYSVHTPLMGREDLVKKYKDKRNAIDSTRSRFDMEGKRRVRILQDHAVYGAMVEAMDAAVGKVINHLRSANLLENTVIIFMSDNGGLSTSEGHPTSNLPLRAGKGWMYEGGIREPMFIYMEGKNNVKINTPVSSVDFFPTMLDMAGVKYDGLDGKSLLPILQGRDNILDDRPIFWHYPHYGNQGGSPSGAIRQGKYKLIRFYETGSEELYDLSKDISEENDLIDKLPEVRNELSEKLSEWLKEVNASMPTENPGYDPENKPYF